MEFIAREVKNQTAVRDWLDGERAVQMFLLTYLGMTEYYTAWTERELNKGYADMFLEPFMAKFPDMRFGYLMELKYITRAEYGERVLEEKIADAEAQLRKYAEDERLQKMTMGYALKRVVLVYNGWELAYCSEVDP